MRTEHGMDIDRESLDHVLANADVLTIGFTTFPQRLLIDTRSGSQSGPLVTLVDPVGSVQERYLWLGKHRGEFPAPQAFSFFVWPQTVRSMVERDALQVMRRRLADTPGNGVEQLDRALDQLRTIEDAEFRRAVRGEGHWRTLWQRTPA